MESGHEAIVFQYAVNIATVRKQIQLPLKLSDFMLQYKEIAQIQFVEATEHEIRRVSIHEGSQAMVLRKLIFELRDGLPRQ